MTKLEKELKESMYDPSTDKKQTRTEKMTDYKEDNMKLNDIPQTIIEAGNTYYLIGVETTESKANKKAIQYAKKGLAVVKKRGNEYLIYVHDINNSAVNASKRLSEFERANDPVKIVTERDKQEAERLVESVNNKILEWREIRDKAIRWVNEAKQTQDPEDIKTALSKLQATKEAKKCLRDLVFLKEDDDSLPGTYEAYLSSLEYELKQIIPKLYDPASLKIAGDKTKLQRLARHLAKEHPSTKGKMQVYDPRRTHGRLPRSNTVRGEVFGDKIKYIDRGYAIVEVGKRNHLSLISPSKGALYSELIAFRKENPDTDFEIVRVYDLIQQDIYKQLIEKYITNQEVTRSQMDHHLKYVGIDISNIPENDRDKAWDSFVNRERKQKQQAIKEWIKTHPHELRALSDYEGRKYDPAPIKLVAGIPARWYEAMVLGIKKKSDVRNPYAIVKNIWARLPAHTQRDIITREKSGEQFHYDLPLPDDRATHGTGTLRMVKPFNLAEAQVNISKKDMQAVKKSGIFRPMKRDDGTICQVARCKGVRPVNIFVDEV